MTLTFGASGFRQSAFEGQHMGSSVVSYTPSDEVIDENSTLPAGKFQSISAMAVYKDKSHEELGWEDYQIGMWKDYRMGLTPYPFGAHCIPFEGFYMGSKRVRYSPTVEANTDTNSAQSLGNLQSISAMQFYKDRSPEELAWEDYQLEIWKTYRRGYACSFYPGSERVDYAQTAEDDYDSEQSGEQDPWEEYQHRSPSTEFTLNMVSTKPLTLESMLAGNGAKELLWKVSDKKENIYRFSSTMMIILLSHMKNVIAYHAKNMVLAFGMDLEKLIGFENNKYDQIFYLKEPKQVHTKDKRYLSFAKGRDFKDLERFIERLRWLHELGDEPVEITEFLELLHNSTGKEHLLIRHYSLWNFGKRVQYFEDVHRLMTDKQRKEENEKVVNKFKSRASRLTQKDFMKKQTDNMNFWDVWKDEDLLMKENFMYHSEGQTKTGGRKRKRVSENYEPYPNTMASLLRLHRNTFQHAKSTLNKKMYSLPDVEFEYFTHFPFFLSLLCEELAKVGLYPRLS